MDTRDSPKLDIRRHISEAVVLAISGGYVYVFTYRWLSAYAAYFGFDSAAISVDLQTVVLVGATMAGLAGFAWFTMATLPYKLFGFICRVIMVHALFLLLFSVTVLHVSYWGFTNAGVVLQILTILGAAFVIPKFFGRGTGGMPYADWLNKEVETLGSVMSESVDGKISMKLGQDAMTIIVVATFVLYYVASQAGAISGDLKHRFMYENSANGVWLLVWSTSDSFYFSEAVKTLPDEHILILTGRTLIRRRDQAKEIELSKLLAVDIVSPGYLVSDWITLSEAMERWKNWF